MIVRRNGILDGGVQAATCSCLKCFKIHICCSLLYWRAWCANARDSQSKWTSRFKLNLNPVLPFLLPLDKPTEPQILVILSVCRMNENQLGSLETVLEVFGWEIFPSCLQRPRRFYFGKSNSTEKQDPQKSGALAQQMSTVAQEISLISVPVNVILGCALWVIQLRECVSNVCTEFLTWIVVQSAVLKQIVRSCRLIFVP